MICSPVHFIFWKKKKMKKKMRKKERIFSFLDRHGGISIFPLNAGQLQSDWKVFATNGTVSELYCSYKLLLEIKIDNL